MRSVGRFGPIALLAVATLAAPALAEGVTVGHFYSAVAEAKQLESADAASAEAGLRGAGFALPSLDLDKGLTEGDMTAISTALGISVTTHRPSQPVTVTQVDTYMSVFATKLRVRAAGLGDTLSVAAGGNDQGDNNNDQGKPPKSKSKP